jgi:hypothetical protein
MSESKKMRPFDIEGADILFLAFTKAGNLVDRTQSIYVMNFASRR